MSDHDPRPEGGHRLAQIVSALLLIDVVICLIVFALLLLHVGLATRLMAGQQSAAVELAANRLRIQALGKPQIAIFTVISVDSFLVGNLSLDEPAGGGCSFDALGQVERSIRNVCALVGPYIL